MKTIVCYGDSNTWGVIPHQSILKRHKKDVRWAGKLAILLGNEYCVEEEGLNGRTTAFHDYIEPHRNGVEYAETCMLTNMPIDLIIIALGTNDAKTHLGNNSFVIGKGMELLINTVQKVQYGVDGKPPKILLVSPIAISDNIKEVYLGGYFNDSKQVFELADIYKTLADTYGCYFIDASKYAKPSLTDAIHMDACEHEKLAFAMANKVKEIFTAN